MAKGNKKRVLTPAVAPPPPTSAADVPMEDTEHEGLLSKELMEELGGNEDELLIMTKKKKTEKKPEAISEAVMAQAKKLSKTKRKKLAQLEARKAKEAKRDVVLQSLEQQQLPQAHLNLMYSTARLGHKETLRERLRRSVNQEKAGLTLTDAARSELYQEKPVVDEYDMDTTESTPTPVAAVTTAAAPTTTTSNAAAAKKKKSKSIVNVVQMPSAAPAVATLAPEATMSEAVSSSSQSALMAKLLELRQKNEEKRLQKLAGTVAPAVADKYADAPKYVPAAIPLPTTSEMVATAETLPVVEVKKTLVAVNRIESIQLSRMQLPVCSSEQEIMEAISLHAVVILCGETGSGKTTQVPQFLYEAGYGFDEHNPGMIGVTQPRRVAAVSTAQRVATELNVPFGKHGSVGYQIRYDNDHVGTETRIKFMTDGILLKEIQQDFLLKKYSIILLDEAHERNVNTDILIGLLSRVAPFRAQMAAEEQEMYASMTPDERANAPLPLKPLKLVIMSATLRVEDFTMNKTLFPSPPPVIKVDARQYPVSVHFNKHTELNDYVHAAYQKVSKIHRKLPDGAILVFLTGQREILQLCRKLRRTMGSKITRKARKLSRRNQGESDANDDWFAREHDDDDEEADVEEAELLGDEVLLDEKDSDASDSEEENDHQPEDDEEGSTENSTPYVHVLPLYSMLANDEQMKVFEAPPPKHRLIVVATNVAETSLTIPGVRYVVDAGRTKERVFDLKTGISEFQVQWISKASADQRAGRAGRTGPGHCYRLYSSAVYENEFPKFSPPQLLTQPIEDVILQMKAMGIERILNFPFPTPPEAIALKAAMTTLMHLGALNMENDTITSLGRTLALFPVAARFAKMLLIAKQVGCLEYIIAVVASLTGQPPFVLAVERKDNEADADEPDEPVISPEEMSDDMAKEWKEAEEMRKHSQWVDEESDVLGMLRAAGAYAYSGASPAFCEENHLHAKIMEQMLKLRSQLTLIVNKLFSNDASYTPVALRPNMPPPSPEEQDTIRQIVAAGYLDHVAHRAPPGTITEGTKIERNCAYVSCSGLVNEPIYIHPHSHVFTREPAKLPPFVVYNTIVRSSRACMKTVTAIEPDWLFAIAQSSPLCKLSEPLTAPSPRYNAALDRVDCFVKPVYGVHQWELPVVTVEYPAGTMRVRWFARCLLDGAVVPSLLPFATRLKEPSASLLRKKFDAKIQLLVMALERNDIATRATLCAQWKKNPKFLLDELLKWIKDEYKTTLTKAWPSIVQTELARTL